MQSGYCTKGKVTAPESLLQHSQGTATEQQWKAGFYLGLSFRGQQKKMKSMNSILPHAMPSSRCCCKHSGVDRHEEDQCFLLYEEQVKEKKLWGIERSMARDQVFVKVLQPSPSSRNDLLILSMSPLFPHTLSSTRCTDDMFFKHNHRTWKVNMLIPE